MKRRQLFFYAGALFALFAVSILAPSCSRDMQSDRKDEHVESKQQAIVNGSKDNGYPAAGALVGGNRSAFCTGTLIAPRLVLTAAHCIDAFAQVQGTLSFRIDIPIDQHQYKSIFVDVDRTNTAKHPKYTGTQQAINHDIAMVVLKRAVFEIQPMPYNKVKMDSSYIGKDLFFMGYGRTSSSSQQPAKQKYSTTLKINGVDGPGKPNTVAYEGVGTSVCQGDSGGPAMLAFNGKMHLIGVTSHGTNRNCTGTSYSFRTDPYVSWIEGFVSKYTTCGPNNPTCGACGTCDQSSCKPKAVSDTPTNCKVCKTDTDCGKGVCVTIGSGLRCAQPCDGTGCCPDGSVCTKGAKSQYCLPNSVKCPAITCTTNAECSPTEECKAGKCILRLPALAKTTCQPCTKHTDCGAGGYCDTPDGRGGRCIQSCQGSGDLCPVGFSCLQISLGLKQCVSKDGTCWVNCKQASDCKGGLTCQSGICQRAGGGLPGEPCDAQLKCKSGLECIKGQTGGRCFLPCGVPKGTAGAPCRTGNVCDAGLRCFPNPLGGAALCVEPCGGGGSCKNGGTCFSQINICTCQNDSQCKNGAKCNPLIQGFAGACTTAKSAACPAGQKCASAVGSQSFCVLENSGTRQTGQACDTLNRCKTGLTCVTGLNICIEDCTKTNVCKGGGTCRSLGGNKYCLCSDNTSCPSGNKCQIVGQGMGYCKRRDETGCKVGDCPTGLVCKDKKCIPGQKPKEEKPNAPHEPIDKIEPPTTSEANPEPILQEPVSKPDGGSVTKEAGTAKEGSKVAPDGPPAKNCGCNVSANNGEPSVPFSFALLLLLVPFLRRRNHHKE